MNYTPEELGSLRAYEYTLEYRDNGEEYLFKTASGAHYSCYFTDASGYFEEYPLIKDDIVSFGFGLVSPSKGFFVEKHNTRIKETIFHILLQANNTYPDRSFFVMYSTRDGKQRNRKITFDKWYNDYCNLVSGRVTRISIISPCTDGNFTFNMMMLVPNTCSKLELIKSTCIEIKDEFISKGYPPSLECRIECK
jgi:hypothetical protein